MNWQGEVNQKMKTNNGLNDPLPGNQDLVVFAATHFLTEDLAVELAGPALPGAGSSTAVRIIPPREALSNPAHLEIFFVTVISLISQASGSTQLAGGRDNFSRSARKEAREAQLRRIYLANRQYATTQPPPGGVRLPTGQNGSAGLGWPAGDGSEWRGLAAGEEELVHRLKGLARRSRPQWGNAVSFEIAGSYRQVCFIVRSANPLILKKVIALLRQQYPNLTADTLETGLAAAGKVTRELTLALNNYSGSYPGAEAAAGAGAGAEAGGVFSDNPDRRLDEGLAAWRKFDPLLLADDFKLQHSRSQWLLLSEDAGIPLALPGHAHSGRQAADLQATPLGPLLDTLADLQPGEIVCSQLLVWGAVDKEWSEYKRSQALAGAAGEWAGPKPVSPQMRGRTGMGPAGRGSGSGSGRGAAGRPPGRPGYAPGAGGYPPQTNGGLLLTGAVLLALLALVLNSWLDFNALSETDREDLTRMVPWFAGRAVWGLGLLSGGFAFWWFWFRSSADRKSHATPSALEVKFSSPPGLAALRQVVSVPCESYLAQVCFDKSFRVIFNEAGFDQRQAARLYKLRLRWLSTQPQARQAAILSAAVKKAEAVNSSGSDSSKGGGGSKGGGNFRVSDPRPSSVAGRESRGRASSGAGKGSPGNKGSRPRYSGNKKSDSRTIPRSNTTGGYSGASPAAGAAGKGVNGAGIRRGSAGPVQAAEAAGRVDTSMLRVALARADTVENRELWGFVFNEAGQMVKKRAGDLKEAAAAAYSSFNSISDNSFTAVPGRVTPAPSFSSLLPYDWASPERLKRAGLAGWLSLSEGFFGRMPGGFARDLPRAAREHAGLQVFNALEMSHLWHLPGGYEEFEFLERTGPKTIGLPPRLANRHHTLLRPAPLSSQGGTGSGGAYYPILSGTAGSRIQPGQLAGALSNPAEKRPVSNPAVAPVSNEALKSSGEEHANSLPGFRRSPSDPLFGIEDYF